MALRLPWETEPERSAPAAPPTRPPLPPLPKPRGRRPSGPSRSGAPSTASPASIWRYHHLTVKGPSTDLERFAAAARGPGIIPWKINGAAIEEDIFIRAVSHAGGSRSLSVAGCRILARQFRERIEAREARARDRFGVSLACPFDLQVLVPIPPAILTLGHDHPSALAWLSRHWGISDLPRQVRVRPDVGPGRRQKTGHGVLGYGFFTAATSPRPALIAIAGAWPDLKFHLLPISTG